jgi:FlaA1/EpsC-like NDP-sugar epimerase
MIRSFLLKKTTLRRALFFMLGDAFLLSLALYLAFYLRFDGNMSDLVLRQYLWSLPVFLVVKFSSFAFFRLYRMSWSYVGFYELLDILKAVTTGLLLILGLVLIFWTHRLFQGYPRSIPFIDYLISLVFIVLFRASKRFYAQIYRGRGTGDAKRTLIVGAGNAGEQIVRDMRRQEGSPYKPVGFIDDDIEKLGVYIQGVKVQGDRQSISYLVEKLNVHLVLIAMPSASSEEIRELLPFVRRSGVEELKIIPGLDELVCGNISLSDIKEIKIEDILGREQVVIDNKAVTNFLKGKRVLITGAGGSIGSELVRQVLGFEPEKIIAVDIDETELHQVELEIGRMETETELVPMVADIRDKDKIRMVFNEYLPDLVFHAAAYKHVPMMERYPEEAVKVNVLGTKVVAEAAIAYGVEKFVMVSTDKAVNPTNIMGATKQVAEKVVKVFNEFEKTSFISVRFGNVIGSRGSVIPIFEEQIRNGGPVTVTHQEMKRYFMSIPEASILILQAAAMGKGGEVFLLEMGDPIRVLDMAREMIRLNGLEPDVDIPIILTGIRPGEKLFEELLTETEGAEPTEHPKIFVGKDSSNNDENILNKILLFEDIIQNNQWATIRNLLMDLVPSYNQSCQDASPLKPYDIDVKLGKEIPAP